MLRSPDAQLPHAALPARVGRTDGYGEEDGDGVHRLGGSLDSTPRGDIGLPLKKRARAGIMTGYPASAPQLGREAGGEGPRSRDAAKLGPGSAGGGGGTNMDSLLQAVQVLEDEPEADEEGGRGGAARHAATGEPSGQRATGQYGGAAGGQYGGAPRFFSVTPSGRSSGAVVEGSPRHNHHHHASRPQLYTGQSGPGGSGRGASEGPGGSYRSGHPPPSPQGHGRPGSAGQQVGGAVGHSGQRQGGVHSAPATALRGAAGAAGAAGGGGALSPNGAAGSQGIPRLEDILGIRLAPCSVPLFCSLQSRAVARAAASGSGGGGSGGGAGPSARSAGPSGGGAAGTSRLANGSAPHADLSAALHRAALAPAANGHRHPLSTALGAGGAASPQLHAALAKGLATPLGPANGVGSAAMSLLLNSPVLAAMPASQMSTMSLLTGLRS